MKWLPRFAALLVGLLACGHSDAWTNADNSVGPSGTGADVLLTYNSEQDYWPTWTQDGKGILYAYVDRENPPGIGHRCVGLLPAAGGSRLWQLCDSRATQGDTVSSFTAYALSNSGQLLYVESVAPKRAPTLPPSITLWLADTAKPFARTGLLTLPVAGLGTPVNWLSDIEWIDAGTFIVLGQLFLNAPHSFGPGAPTDSIFADSVFDSGGGGAFASGVVLVGTISGGHATLRVVAGTNGATSYARTTDGTTIVFTHRDDQRLYRVPIGGGTVTVVGTVTPNAGQLVGVSCQSTSCIVAFDPLRLFYGGSQDGTRAGTAPAVLTGPREVRSISLGSGAVQVIWTSGTTGPIVATPRISPTSSDVVMQIGGVWGHLQTVSSGASNLHLYHGLIP